MDLKTYARSANKKGYVMKIESSEVMMQSQHSFEKIELQSSMSFESFIQLPDDTVSQTQETIPTANNSSEDYNAQRTLSEIIQQLINALSLNKQNSSMSREDITKEVDNAIGYSHLSLYTKYEEHESVSMSTKAFINTDQGSLDLDINYSMSRDFVVENQIDIYSLIDPLVINLDGSLPSLSSDTFNFDIDNDGESDQISKLGSNSGFLALDKNNDGEINQGSELFGTKTGDGFGELSAYDSDNNGWIDENDPIFDKLQIWLKNDDEKEKELVGLGEVGIGAIFLGSTDTDFTFKTNTNQTLGQIKESGFYLNEDFSTGAISKIDLSKQQSPTQASPLGQLLRA